MSIPNVLSPVVPGRVINLTCPDSYDAGVLDIRWELPNINSHSINDYLVEVQEYFQSPNSSVLGSRSLTPPFLQEVQSAEIKMAVTSGVGM